jgi:hypothetical protein
MGSACGLKWTNKECIHGVIENCKERDHYANIDVSKVRNK